MINLICFSHLRWNFVYQRPQHLLSRAAKHFRVFFIEEPIFDTTSDYYELVRTDENLYVVTPHVENNLAPEVVNVRLGDIISQVFEEMHIEHYIFWYYTPMALPMSKHFDPIITVYDCMDELSAFKFAPSSLQALEKELLEKADLMFTGGYSLYEAKKHLHRDIYPFPSSIDKSHFEQSRSFPNTPVDQASIPSPRIGFSGVIDERMDLTLLEGIARLRPQWNFILLGPIVKIDPSSLPKLENIHYLGMKSYNDLPSYIAAWNIAMIPFARNESTQFISPTKTPEYLAAGKPVISTSIKDIVSPYGEKKLVHIADTPEEFVKIADAELAVTDREEWLQQVDAFLAQSSWDKTWNEMHVLVNEKLKEKNIIPMINKKVYV